MSARNSAMPKSRSSVTDDASMVTEMPRSTASPMRPGDVIASGSS